MIDVETLSVLLQLDIMENAVTCRDETILNRLSDNPLAFLSTQKDGITFPHR